MPVVTASNVTFHLTPAGLGTRAAAYLVDATVGWVIKLGGVYALAGAGEGGIALIISLFFLVDVAYFAFFEWCWSGQTPGKRWAGLRVVSTEGGRVEPAAVVIRNLLRFLDGLPVLMGVGFVAALFHPHGRRLGDLVAGTVVVAEPRRRPHASVLQEAGVASLAQRANSLATPATVARVSSRVRVAERDLLLDLAARRDRLDPLPRARLFRDAAALCRRRFDLPVLEHLTDEQAVLGVVLILGDGSLGDGAPRG